MNTRIQMPACSRIIFNVTEKGTFLTHFHRTRFLVSKSSPQDSVITHDCGSMTTTTKKFR